MLRDGGDGGVVAYLLFYLMISSSAAASVVPCVSAIAWGPEVEAEAWEMLAGLGIRDLELPPARYFPDVMAATEGEARGLGAAFAERGFRIRSFQALLFGQADLQLFGDGSCEAYLTQLCRLAGWMGAGALVFGSPKNRLRGGRSAVEARAEAGAIFRRIGVVAEAAGTALCLEANPSVYGGDFLLTSMEVAELVRELGMPGIRMNVDLGEMALNELDVRALLPVLLPLAGHFHVSEPMLEPFAAGRGDHAGAAEILASQGYAGAVSLEMKAPAGGLAALRVSVEEMLRAYFPGQG